MNWFNNQCHNSAIVKIGDALGRITHNSQVPLCLQVLSCGAFAPTYLCSNRPSTQLDSFWTQRNPMKIGWCGCEFWNTASVRLFLQGGINCPNMNALVPFCRRVDFYLINYNWQVNTVGWCWLFSGQACKDDNNHWLYQRKYTGSILHTRYEHTQSVGSSRLNRNCGRSIIIVTLIPSGCQSLLGPNAHMIQITRPQRWLSLRFGNRYFRTSKPHRIASNERIFHCTCIDTNLISQSCHFILTKSR